MCLFTLSCSKTSFRYAICNLDENECLLESPDGSPNINTRSYPSKNFTGGNALHDLVLSDSFSRQPLALCSYDILHYDVLHYDPDALLSKMPHTNVNELNNEGYSPLQLAILQKKDLMIERIISVFQGSIDLNIKDASNQTILHLAVLTGSKKIVRLILGLESVKNQLSQQDIHGQTPLHIAAKNGNVQVLKMLSKAKYIQADIKDIKDINDKTALDLAKENHHEPCVKYLVNSTLLKKSNFCSIS